VARDRKRAKRRGNRGRGAPADSRETRAGAARAASPAAAGAATEPPSPSVPLGGGPPSPVDHASGEVEEFDAALAGGAATVPGAGPPAAVGGGPGEFDEALAGGAAEAEEADSTSSGNGGLADAEALAGDASTPLEVEEEEEDGNGSSPADVAARAGLETPTRRRGAARAEPRARKQSLPARAVAFLRASWAELQRMQWPDRRQTSQATAVVLGFVVIAGVYLGIADWVAQKLVNLLV
jgi:preprotein translocase subunit SecE